MHGHLKPFKKQTILLGIIRLVAYCWTMYNRREGRFSSCDHVEKNHRVLRPIYSITFPERGIKAKKMFPEMLYLGVS